MYLDFMPQGDLMKVLNKFTQMEVGLAQFYVSQIVLCFEYLHSKSMVFRDLKPENVLVHDNGYLKLADFGFIKQLRGSERTFTFCGTPEYMAPEILLNKGYCQPVDWYALGIMLFELLYGRPPFMHSDTYQLFEMTLHEKLKFPKDFDRNAKSLIKKLTKHDLTERYGNLVGGVNDIKEHKFFKGVDWQKLLTFKVDPPYKPEKPLPKLERQHMGYYELEEFNDDTHYPPIKEVKDPFITFF